MKRGHYPMRKSLQFILVTALITSCNLSSIEQDSRTLPPNYKKWLEEEVVYIITPKERKVFIQLKNDRDRDIFIKAFWKQRDPIPLTESNEFKEEHYRRIGYVDRHFRIGTPIPSWKTDRGRIYIILGPPKNIETYEKASSVYPTIVWFYQGMSKYGLPDAFYIVFFKNRGVGDYKLYSPTMDGPQSLLAHYNLGQMNFSSAYRELQSIDPNLAKISLSLIPGGTSYGTNSSMASDKLLFNINSIPQKIVKDEYAEKLLMYKDIVEVEYTSNYIASDFLVTIIQDNSGIFFVNYLFEIDSLSMESYEGKYFTNININGKVSDFEGNTIFQYEKSVPLEFSKEQFDKIKSIKYSFQDTFPLVAGNYRFNLLAKNEASKEFTTIEEDITVPQSSSLQMSDLILAYKMEKSLSSEEKKAFKIKDFQLYPSPRNDFTARDRLFLFFQMFGLDEELMEKGILEIIIYKEESKLQSQRIILGEYKSLDYFLEEYPLTSFSPDYYKVKVSLFNKDEEEILFKEKHFIISPLVILPRPWINSAILPHSDNPIYLHILGNQLLMMKKFEKAQFLLKEAYYQCPTQIQFALSYSNILFVQREYKTIIEILTPLLMKENYEVLKLLAESCHALGEFEKAISYYNSYISHYGTTYSVLTVIGDCYYQLGNKEEALRAWHKSLEINPNQEEIKKLVDSIKR